MTTQLNRDPIDTVCFKLDDAASRPDRDIERRLAGRALQSILGHLDIDGDDVAGEQFLRDRFGTGPVEGTTQALLVSASGRIMKLVYEFIALAIGLAEPPGE
jgi:hypothetical protein